jgi:hypothetical protein
MYSSMSEAENVQPERPATFTEGVIGPAPGTGLVSAPYLGLADAASRWQPILHALGSQIAAEFVWVATTDTIETYEHRETRRYVHLDGKTGEFLNQKCHVISREKALEHARKPAGAKILHTPAPPPFVEPFVQFPEPEPTVKAFAQVTEPVTEPELNAFIRTHGLDPEPPFWDALATGVDALQPGLSSSLGLFAEIRQRLLARIASWGAHPFSSNHDDAHGNGISAPDAQQVNFGMFTRRTSAL